MSRVTDIILITFLEEEDNVQKLNEKLMECNDNFQVLKDVTHAFGGNKFAQLGCYGCAYNHLGKSEEFIEMVKAIDWKERDRVLLILNEEEAEKPVVITL